ncbi:hypothetical protein [Nocardioides sp.]|uniref:hypothetical protein n=1 Tax=Nocardioides sp. TaxID=35761 RepID=UPI002ED2247D
MTTVERPALGSTAPPTYLRRLAVLLGIVSAAAAALTAFVPDVLVGTPVMNGSARGTALVVLFVALPVLAGSTRSAHRGSTRALAVWVGVAGYLTYNAVMFCIATPFNRLFPLYVAMLSLSIFLLAGLGVHAARAGRHLTAGRCPRWIAVYIAVVVVLNGLLWLRGVAAAVIADDPMSFLAGSGLTTNPVYVQDLAFWLPVMGWLAYSVATARRDRWVLVAGGLVFWVIEGLGVAVDQWMGYRADPTTVWATAGAVWLFVVTTAIGLVPAWAALRELPSRAAADVSRLRT